MIDKIYRYYDSKQREVLLTPSLNVIFPLEKKIADIISNLKNILAKLGGAGLAAPQLGFNHKIIACSFSRNAKDVEIMINPEYKNVSKEKNTLWEGCYSLPLTAILVERWNNIQINYQTETGKSITKNLKEQAARIFQHEVDHINGKLINHKAIQQKAFKNNELFKNFIYNQQNLIT